MTTPLLILGFLCFLILVLRKREWGIYLILILLPTYQIRFSLGFIPVTFLEGLVLLLAFVEIADLFRQKRLLTFLKDFSKARKWETGFILFFLLAALSAVFVSPVRVQAAGIFKAYFLETVLFYFLVVLIIHTPQKLSGLWKSLGLLVLYLSIFGIYQFVTLTGLPFSWWAVAISSRRIVSLLNHPNALALLIAPLLAMLFALPKSKLAWFTLGLGIITLYLSFSRAAWLALLVVIIALGLLSSQKKKILAAVLGVILLLLVVPFSRQKLVELLPGNAPTQENRYVLWAAATDMLKKSPFFGVGLMGFHEYYKNYPLGPDRVIQNYPHNFFLNFWLETGLAGLLSVLGFLFLFYKKIRALLRTNFRTLALAAGAGMAMILLHGLVDVPYFKNDLSLLFWLIVALPDLPFLPKP